MKLVPFAVAVFAIVLAMARGADAQVPAPTPRIGFLGLDRVVQAERVAALVAGLRALDYEDGRNVVIEYRWAAGDAARLPALADELVRLKVDVIVTASILPAVDAARRATTTIPIVI